MTFGSAFAGLGGFDIGLSRVGMECVWQVEIDDYATRLLERHWPKVRRHRDIRSFPPDGSWERPDVICGGFPCQGISASNYRGQGLADERSGLWRELARIIGLFRPSYAILENVPALTFRGLGTVLGDLAALRFDAEWQVLSAQAFGAPHDRERIFIVAYPVGERCQEDEIFSRSPFETASTQQASRLRHWPGRIECSGALHDRVRWTPHSELCRVANVAPDELDRYRVVGNAVLWQPIEWIGRRILEVGHT